MQVPTLDAATFVAVPTGGGVTARVVAGNLATVPVGALLEATVTSVSPREVALTVNGTQLTVRPPVGLPAFRPGAALVVRVPVGTQLAPTLELFAPAPQSAQPTPQPTATTVPLARAVPPTTTEGAPGAITSTPAPARAPAAPARPAGAPTAAPRLAVVNVLAPAPDGRVRVTIDGAEYTARAATAEPLAPGGRYVLQVERGAAGVVLKSPPPNAPGLATEIATAVLRVPAADLGATVAPLRAELAALAQPQTAAPVRAAAVAVRETLDSFVPTEPRPPDATELQRLVENGGRHFEAKLARLVEAADAPDGPVPAKPNAAAPEPPDAPTAATKDGAVQVRDAQPRSGTEAARVDVGPDLKGDVLRLLQAVSDLGGTTRAPVAEAALHGIEAQQAGQVLAQSAGTPYYLQVPFPDGGVWRTLSLALEPQARPDQPDAERAGRFRVFMHVPLTELGETWIEAGLAADRLRATIYLDRAAARDRVRADLGDLRAELAADGYTEVLLDVRAASDLPARHRRETGALAAGRPATVSVLDVKV